MTEPKDTASARPGGFQNTLQELPGLFSLLAFLVITAILFRSWEFALIVTASLGFHELGHALALSWYGLEYRIYFGLVGAWTWSRTESRAQLSQLSNAYVHLAGPLFSLLLALIALGIHQFWLPHSDYLLMLANFSAQVGFLNLLPLGILTDGGKALRRMAISVESTGRRLPVLLLGSAAVIGPAVYLLYHLRQTDADHLSSSLLGLLLVGAWLAAGMFSELWRVGPPVLSGSRVMSAKQVTFITVLIWDMLVLQFSLIASTPFWLSPQYLLGLVQNLHAALQWISSIM